MWPVGKYNGQRVVGVMFKLKIVVNEWRWKPVIMLKHIHACHWLCFYSWFEWEYEDEMEKRIRLEKEGS